MFLAAAAVTAVAVLTGCRTVRYVSVPEIHTEVKVKTDSFVCRDTSWLHDSVSVFVKGDTVYKTKVQTKYGYRYIYKHLTDTVCRTDSVGVPYPVERQLGWWEKTKQKAFVPVAVALAILALIAGWRIRNRNDL